MDWNGNDSNCTDIIKHIGSKEGFVKTKSFFNEKIFTNKNENDIVYQYSNEYYVK